MTYETLLSGQGLVRLFEFVRTTHSDAPSAELRTAMQSGDAAATISEFALAGRDAIAERALDLFVSIYGAQAGNLALATVPRGEMYVAGGIAPTMVAKLTGPIFMNTFHAKDPDPFLCTSCSTPKWD